jgi:ABC-2 type transport system ATP-binding protein
MAMLIEAKKLHKHFGELRAVDGLSLCVSAGEIYGLVGPDGAGKTTTLRLLCGAYYPHPLNGDDKTSIRIAGFDVLMQTEQARAQIGYLPQQFSLYEDLTVMENLRFFAEVRGMSAGEWQPRCSEILNFVGLESFHNRRAGILSGGMKQKLGLAVALIHRPRVLLLDEPTTGVDPVTRQDFWQLLIRLVGQTDGTGSAVLVSTPYMDEASRCSRIGFLNRGRLIVEDSPIRLRAGLEGRILELIGTPLHKLRILAQDDEDVEDVQMFGDRIHMRIRQGQTAVVEKRLNEYIPKSGATLLKLRSIEPELEDVFMGLAERAESE